MAVSSLDECQQQRWLDYWNISNVKPTGFDEEGKRKGSTGDLTKIFTLTIRKVEFPFSLHEKIESLASDMLSQLNFQKWQVDSSMWVWIYLA